MDYVTMLLIAAVVLLLAKFVLKINLRSLIGLIINILLGIIIIWLINRFTGLAIPLNFITALVVGILGVPGVIILVLLRLIGII